MSSRQQLFAHVGAAVDQQHLATGFDQDGCSSAPVAWLGGVARAPVIPDPRHASRGPAAENSQLHAVARENNRKKFAVVVSARVLRIVLTKLGHELRRVGNEGRFASLAAMRDGREEG